MVRSQLPARVVKSSQLHVRISVEHKYEGCVSVSTLYFYMKSGKSKQTEPRLSNYFTYNTDALVSKFFFSKFHIQRMKILTLLSNASEHLSLL